MLLLMQTVWGGGGAVVDLIPGSVSFNNGGTPISNKVEENYANLKTQCYFLLAEGINKGRVSVRCEDVKISTGYYRRAGADKDC